MFSSSWQSTELLVNRSSNRSYIWFNLEIHLISLALPWPVWPYSTESWPKTPINYSVHPYFLLTIPLLQYPLTSWFACWPPCPYQHYSVEHLTAATVIMSRMLTVRNPPPRSSPQSLPHNMSPGQAEWNIRDASLICVCFRTTGEGVIV